MRHLWAEVWQLGQQPGGGGLQQTVSKTVTWSLKESQDSSVEKMNERESEHFPCLCCTSYLQETKEWREECACRQSHSLIWKGWFS